MRFGLELNNVNDIFLNTDFKVFNDIANKNGQTIKAINLKEGADLTRKEIDELTEFAGVYGAKGLAYIKVLESGEWQSPIVKFFSEEEKTKLKNQLNMEPGDIVFFGAGKTKIVNDSLGHIRKKLAKDRGMIPPDTYAFTWVVDFPMFEYDENEKRLKVQEA